MDRRKFEISLLSLFAASAAQAQTPSQTVVWSGFPPGGLGDQVSRPLIQRMKARWPGTLIYDIKAGASGRLAIDFVKRSSPDGGHVVQTTSSAMTVYPHTYGARLQYDPLADFTPIGPVVFYTFALVVGPAVPADVKSIAQLVQWATANPNLANYGIPAVGSTPHFAGIMFERASNISLKSVPYKGSGPLLVDLLGGHISMGFHPIGEVYQYAKEGKLRLLAVTSPQRWPSVPEVPTFAELGFRNVSNIDYIGWYAPAKTPMSFVRQLNQAMQEALDEPAMKELFEKLSLQGGRESPEVFAARVRADLQRWGPIVRSSGVTAED